jgi:hypothetical protein
VFPTISKLDIITCPKTTSALSADSTRLILENLVFQEDPCYIVQLEGVQAVLTTHVQEQVQSPDDHGA